MAQSKQKIETMKSIKIFDVPDKINTNRKFAIWLLIRTSTPKVKTLTQIDYSNDKTDT